MQKSDQVFVQILKPGAALPLRASGAAAGYDLAAALDKIVILPAGGRALVPTGIALELPMDMEAQVRSRSGLAWKHGISVLNSPGTIDSDYRGEVGVILQNHGAKDVAIEPGMRIAQLVFARVAHPELIASASLGATERGDGGFGHSGE
ncbi:MAG: dUTP diphosphatase [Spirochaetota bacterium]|jgi:dUTP pyrophosphatase|nr:dUTP diphosphatase [Spirochaetota bacterium]